MSEETGPKEADIKAKHEQWKKNRLEEQPVSLEDLLNLYRKWLYLEETADIEVVLACALDREILGDPVWLQLIAPSGDKKTEIMRSLKDYSKAYTLDTLTTKTLVSGLPKKNKDTGEAEPAAGLLEKIHGKVLMIKDFTTTLGRSEEYRTELYGQLRSIYDGYYEVGFGSLPEPIRIECEIGMILGCTPAIDKYNRLENTLGTRFLKIRSDSDPIKAAERALENAELGGPMRFQLRNGVSFFFKNLIEREVFEPGNVPRLEEWQKSSLISIALYISKMRASVWGKYDRFGTLLSLEAISIEKPTRVAKQLMKLAQLLAIIRGHKEIQLSELSTICRVARDTAEPTRQRIIDAFYDRDEKLKAPLTIQDIDGITKMLGKRIHYRTARNELEIMDALELVDRYSGNEYRINEGFIPFVQAVSTHYIWGDTDSEKPPKNGLFSEDTPPQSIRDDSTEGQLVDFATRLLTRHGGSMGSMIFWDTLHEAKFQRTDVEPILGQHSQFIISDYSVNLRKTKEAI